MDKHTAGPWFYRKSATENEYAVYSNQECSGDDILTYGGCGCCNASDESITLEADARLMASAPELLEALEVWVKYNDDSRGDVEAMLAYADALNLTRAAIAKARGE